MDEPKTAYENAVDLKNTVVQLEKLVHAHNNLLKVGCVRVGSANAADTVESFLKTLSANTINAPLDDAAFRTFTINWIKTVRESLGELKSLPEDETLRIIERY